LYRYRDGGFDGFPNSALSNAFIQDLVTDSEGNLWISAYTNGLFRFREGLFQEIQPAMLRSDSGTLYDLDMGLDGLWIAHRDGLFLYKNGSLKRFGREDGYDFGTPYTLHQTSDRRLWISSQKGLVTYQTGSFQLFENHEKLSDDIIYNLYEDRQGMLWVGTYKALNRIYHNQVEVEVVQNEAFSVDAVSAVLEDREGNLWVGRDHTGLFVLKNARFQTYTQSDGLPTDMVNAVFQTTVGDMYAATNGGLAQFKEEKFHLVPAKTGSQVTPAIALAEGLQNDLWVGYEDGSIRIFRDGNDRLLETTDAHFHQKPIFVISNDGKGRMWIGSVKSIAVMSAETGKLLATMSFDRDIHCFLPQEDRIWVGQNGGLGYFENYDLDRWVEADGLDQSTVVFLQEDENDNIWVATYGNGIWYGKDGEWVNISKEQGLFDNKIFSMVPDNRGYFWFSSNRGISRVAKRALYAVVEGREARFESREFGLEDGIVSLECNGGSQPSAIRNQDGRIWFTTTRGTATVRPGFGLLDPVPPPVYVTGIVADGINLDLGDGLSIEGEIKQVGINYTALHFANPDNLRFQYKLEPYDDQWREAGSRRVAYYNNLPSGEYKFHLQAISKDGIRGELEQSVQFRMKQIWWKQVSTVWISFFLLFSILGAIVFWKFRVYLKEQNRATLKLNNISRDLANLQPKLQDSEQRLLHLEHRIGLEDLGQQVLSTVSRMLGVVQREVASIERGIKAARSDKSLMMPKSLYVEQVGMVRQAFDREKSKIINELQKFEGDLIDQEAGLLKEVVNLRDRIHQVSELIEAQQQYAKTNGGSDAVDVNALMEDAIRLLHDLPAKYDIQLIQDLLPLPTVRIAKSKLLQAVSLLVREACFRMQYIDQEEKRILLVLTKTDENGAVIIRIDQRGNSDFDPGEHTVMRRLEFVEKLISDLGCEVAFNETNQQWCSSIVIPVEMVVKD
jgi:ligand-binding sensor domain-containing protein